jgi:hypothetical protein
MLDADSRLEKLRKKHPRFFFRRFEYQMNGDTLEVLFYFHTDPDLEFTSRFVFLGVGSLDFTELSPAVVHNWLFNIGMVEALSYWKASCSPEFVVEADSLSEEQVHFWKKLLQNGLSEFFFVNNIDGWQDNFVKIYFTIQESGERKEVDQHTHANTVLVPVGGGKDSIVTLELLKKTHTPISTFTLNKNDQVRGLLSVVGDLQNISVERNLDPKLLELNKQNYFNGHTPFSALLSFVSTFCAYIFDFQFVALSNEQSANEANILFLGRQINHQYSKSFEYEQDFRLYLQKNLSKTIEYFSFLRPLHELQIAEIFARYPQYFSRFLSCNVGQKTGKWCGNCPKCLFVFIMLSPFVDEKTLREIWGENLLEKESLLPILEELTGLRECKSLECVGTRQETILALALTMRKYSILPALLAFAKDNLLQNGESWQELEKRAQVFLKTFSNENFIPKRFATTLQIS